MIVHDKWLKVAERPDHTLYGRFQWTEKEEYVFSDSESELLEENNVEVIDADEQTEVVFSYEPGHSETWDMSLSSVDSVVEDARDYRQTQINNAKARKEYFEAKALEAKNKKPETPFEFFTKLALSLIVPAAVEYVTGQPVTPNYEELI